MPFRLFCWEVVYKSHADGKTQCKVVFTSQQWREYIWKHDLVIIVPDVLKYHDALLYMTGGICKNVKPVSDSWTDKFVTFMTHTAKTTWQSQPYFCRYPINRFTTD